VGGHHDHLTAGARRVMLDELDELGLGRCHRTPQIRDRLQEATSGAYQPDQEAWTRLVDALWQRLTVW